MKIILRPGTSRLDTTMSSQHALDHNTNVYVSITLSPDSPAFHNPELLVVHPVVVHLGRVGELHDVQLLSVPRISWTQVQGDVLSSLHGITGVKHVEVQQTPTRRVKRGDEF